MFRTNQQSTKYTISKSQMIIVQIIRDTSTFPAIFRGTTVNAIGRQFAVDGGTGRNVYQSLKNKLIYAL